MNSGIICKVWNIQGNTNTKNASGQLKDSIGYILNDEKTDFELNMKNSAINDPEGQLGRECKYVENDIKTVSGAYVGSRNLVSTDVKDAVAEMMEVKEFYGKIDGRAALHGIISLPEEESDIQNASLLMQLCEDVLKEVFPNNQAIFGVHTNTKNLHIHFIINSVGLDGKKIHQDDRFMKEVLHPCINKYAKKYGLTPNEKWEMEYEDRKKTFVELKMSMRKAIDLAIEKAEDFTEFVQELKENGFTVNVGKYISVKSDEMGKPIRTHNLGANYTKDAIVERIATKRRDFADIKVNDYVLNKESKDIFVPVISKMKKYKDMDTKEKAYVLRQLKIGKNPWREHQQLNWQLNNIADQLNTQERVVSYVEFYSDNGTLQGALDGIIEAKKKIGEEKKLILAQRRKYKPILDIYAEMKPLQRKAYLYEHENISEYRAEFEQYRILTRRLKNGYNKDVIEVADFLEECEERLIYARAQLHELSMEYREIKQYATQHGEQITPSGRLMDTIGFYDARRQEKNHIFEADYFYIVSDNNPDLFIRVIKTVTTNRSGEPIQGYELTVISAAGEIIEQIDNKNGMKDFSQNISGLEERYGFNRCKKLSNASIARDYMDALGKKEISRLEERDAGQFEMKNTMSFLQAANHTDNKGKMSIMVDTETSAYFAISILGEKEIKIIVFDKDKKIQESVKIPPVTNKTEDGYKKMVLLQKKYGFSDRMITFENMEEAKDYIASKTIQSNEKDNKRRDEWRL